MISSLGHYLNKNLLVSLPSIFEDAEPRACTLSGIEASGLWLSSDDLAKRFLSPEERRVVTHIFVPFTQIAYLLEERVVTQRKPTANRKTAGSVIKDRPARKTTREKTQASVTKGGQVRRTTREKRRRPA
jgi:hypothetical protein